MCGPSDGEHRLGNIHPNDVEALFRHEGCHSSRTAADVGYLTDASCCDQLCKGNEQRPVDGSFCRRADFSPYELNIPRRRYVVDRSGGRYMVPTGHT